MRRSLLVFLICLCCLKGISQNTLKQHVFLLNSTKYDQAHYNLPKLLDYAGLIPIPCTIDAMGFDSEEEVQEFLQLLYGIKKVYLPVVLADSTAFFKLNPRGTMAWALTNEKNEWVDTLNTWDEVELIMNHLGPAYDFTWKKDSFEIAKIQALGELNTRFLINNYGYLIRWNTDSIYADHLFNIEPQKVLDFGDMNRIYKRIHPKGYGEKWEKKINSDRKVKEKLIVKILNIYVGKYYTYALVQTNIPKIIRKKKKHFLEYDSARLLFRFENNLRLKDYGIFHEYQWVDNIQKEGLRDSLLLKYADLNGKIRISWTKFTSNDSLKNLSNENKEIGYSHLQNIFDSLINYNGENITTSTKKVAFSNTLTKTVGNWIGFDYSPHLLNIETSELIEYNYNSFLNRSYDTTFKAKYFCQSLLWKYGKYACSLVQSTNVVSFPILSIECINSSGNSIYSDLISTQSWKLSISFGRFTYWTETPTSLKIYSGNYPEIKKIINRNP